MIIQSKQTEYYGNECVIYKTVILYEYGNKYAVAVLTNYLISWASDEPSSDVKNFDKLEQAQNYYNSL